ncbi:MAG: V-type ATPase subunit [Promethearchaeota archaeon]
MAVLSMSVVVDSYEYTLIKIASLKSLIIPHGEFLKLGRISDLKKLIGELDKYYPGLSLKFQDKEVSIIDLEIELYKIFYKIYEKILTASPRQLQDFLRSLLYRYEVWNLKTLLAGTLANMDRDAIRKEIVMKPEELLQRRKFIETLLKQDNITYILRILRKSRYAGIIKRGYYYFTQRKEIFLLEALLDKFFVENLYKTQHDYTGKEKGIFKNAIDVIIQKYNLMLIYRSFRNNVPKELLKQLTIPAGSIFTADMIAQFVSYEKTSDFIIHLRSFIQSHRELKKIEILKTGTDSDLITHLLSVLNKDIFKKLTETNIADIDSITIKRVLSFIFNKENEIYRVLGLLVKTTYNLKE